MSGRQGRGLCNREGNEYVELFLRRGRYVCEYPDYRNTFGPKMCRQDLKFSLAYTLEAKFYVRWSLHRFWKRPA